MIKTFQDLEPQFLIRVLKNEVTEEEKEVFNKWLESNDEHKEEFGQIALLWEKSAKLPTPLAPDLNLEWNKFQIKLLEEISKENRQKRLINSDFQNQTKSNVSNQQVEKFFSVYFKKYVVITRVAALILISLIAYWFLSKPLPVQNIPEKRETKFYEFITNRGEKATIPLSDGSIVYLNADSKLTYPQFFDSEKRYLKFEGEGYFLIKHESNRPFIVQTGNKFTVVKGTEFNIKFRKNKLSVVVTKGRVILYNQDSSKFVDLVKGQLSFTNGDDFSAPINVDTKLYTAWRMNKLSFVETPLEEVLEEIERVYNVDTICKNKKILSRTLTGYFDSNSLDEILNKISLALDFKFQRKGGKIFIF